MFLYIIFQFLANAIPLQLSLITILRAVIMHLLAKVGVAVMNMGIMWYNSTIASVYFICTVCSLHEI